MESVPNALDRLDDLAAETDGVPTWFDVALDDEAPHPDELIEAFGSWPEAFRAAGADVDYAPETPPDDLLDALHGLWDDLGHPPPFQAVASSGPSVGSYVAAFGSWSGAFRAAGVPADPPPGATYSDVELVRHLQARAIEIRRPPRASKGFDADDAPSVSVYYNRFGSWHDALAAAGIDVDGGQVPTYTESDLEAHLRAYADEHGSIPRAVDVEEWDEAPSQTTYQRYYDGWDDALRAAGLPPRNGKSYTDEELLQLLRALADELGRPPKSADLSGRPEYPSQPLYHDRFPSWAAALDRAGLGRPPSSGHYTDEELLDHLYHLRDELGRSPRAADLGEFEGPSVGPYRTNFGSWKRALAAAEMAPPDPGPDEDELAGCLRRLASELGRPPSPTDVRQSDSSYRPADVTQRFESWDRALAAADLDPAVSPGPTDEALLGWLQELDEAVDGPVGPRDVDEHPGAPPARVVVDHFGSWFGALDAAGLRRG